MITKIEFQVTQQEIDSAEDFLQSKKLESRNTEDKLKKHRTTLNQSDFATVCVSNCIEVYKAKRDHRAIITLLNATYHLNIMLGSDLLLLKSGQAVTLLL